MAIAFAASALCGAIITAGLATADEIDRLQARQSAVVDNLRDQQLEIEQMRRDLRAMAVKLADHTDAIDRLQSREAPPAKALSQVFTRGGHNQITCTAAGVDIKIADSAGNTQPLDEITLSNPTSTIVRIVSNNGVAIANGTPICNSASCVAQSIRIPAGGGVFKCATDAGTQAVYLLGGM